MQTPCLLSSAAKLFQEGLSLRRAEPVLDRARPIVMKLKPIKRNQ